MFPIDLFQETDAGVQPESFQGRGGFVELKHFDKLFVKNTSKKGSAGKKFWAFSPRYYQNYILNRRFNPWMDAIRAYFSKIRALFSIFKKGKGKPRSPPSPRCVPEMIRTLSLPCYFIRTKKSLTHFIILMTFAVVLTIRRIT